MSKHEGLMIGKVEVGFGIPSRVLIKARMHNKKPEADEPLVFHYIIVLKLPVLLFLQTEKRMR